MPSFNFLSSWFTSNLVSKKATGFDRLQTQSLSIGMQYIVDGVGFTTNWAELDVTSESSRYAAFDVPDGFYMALDARIFSTSSEDWWYHVYPQGTYTLGTEKTDSATTGFIKTRNLRQDSTFTPDVASRYNVTAAPTRVDDSIIDEPMWGEGGSGSGNKAVGNLASDDTFLMLNGNQQFLLELYNGGVGAGNAHVHLNYAFIPESLISPLEV